MIEYICLVTGNYEVKIVIFIMADFLDEKESVSEPSEHQEIVENDAKPDSEVLSSPLSLVDFSNPIIVEYCLHCSMPNEYCQYGPQFKDKCLPYMQANMSEEELARALGQVSLAGGIQEVGPKKSRIVKKDAEVFETKIVIARIQRQKKKFVTSVLGLDTVASLKGKLDDAAKFFKKKFSCGASVGETPSGALEVVIQGDVSLELPDKLMSEYKVSPSNIWFLEAKDQLRCYA